MKNKKLNIESLKKENIYQVPDDYFDKLPLKIQTKINASPASTKQYGISRMQLSWSLTAAVVILLIGWIYYPNNDLTADQILADIQSEDLIEYLHEENISTEDILASIDTEFLMDEMSVIESEMIDENLTDEDLELIYSELDYSTEIM